MVNVLSTFNYSTVQSTTALLLLIRVKKGWRDGLLCKHEKSSTIHRGFGAKFVQGSFKRHPSMFHVWREELWQPFKSTEELNEVTKESKAWREKVLWFWNSQLGGGVAEASQTEQERDLAHSDVSNTGKLLHNLSSRQQRRKLSQTSAEKKRSCLLVLMSSPLFSRPGKTINLIAQWLNCMSGSIYLLERFGASDEFYHEGTPCIYYIDCENTFIIIIINNY